MAPLAQFGQFGGLAGVMATEKTSAGIFDALKARRTYGVSSAQRIILDVDLNGTSMGNRAPYSERVVLRVRVMGTRPLDEIVVVKNGSAVYSNRPPPIPLSSRATVRVAFESSSAPFVRDSPRGHRIWDGTLTVKNGRLEAATSSSENRHMRELRIDPADSNRLSFHLKTRGDAEVLTLQLEGAGRSTELVFQLAETEEMGSSRPLIRPYATIPARELRLAFSQLQGGEARAGASGRPSQRHDPR